MSSRQYRCRFYKKIHIRRIDTQHPVPETRSEIGSFQTNKLKEPMSIYLLSVKANISAPSETPLSNVFFMDRISCIMLPRVVSRGSSELVVFSPGGVFFDDIKYFIAVNPFGENAISFDWFVCVFLNLLSDSSGFLFTLCSCI